MRKNIVLFILLISTAAYYPHRSSSRLAAAGHAGLPIPFNPQDGSTYQYQLTSKTNLKVSGGVKYIDLHSKFDFVVHYGISKEEKGYELDMNFDKLHVHASDGKKVTDVDAVETPAASKPMGSLLAALKANGLFARVHAADYTVVYSGMFEVIRPVLERYYAQPDLEGAIKTWGQWVETEIVWKNLDPLTLIFPDSAFRIGDRWQTIWHNREDINFVVYSTFQLESVSADIATIRSTGLIGNDPDATMLQGNRFRGPLTGKESGVFLVDIKTGMLLSMTLSEQVRGAGTVGGRLVVVDWNQATKMEGKKVK